jgi:hypothetical protein
MGGGDLRVVDNEHRRQGNKGERFWDGQYGKGHENTLRKEITVTPMPTYSNSFSNETVNPLWLRGI